VHAGDVLVGHDPKGLAAVQPHSLARAHRSDPPGRAVATSGAAPRDVASARRFFTMSLLAHLSPAEVITDRAPTHGKVIDELIPAAFNNTGQYENNRCECDHGRLNVRLRPMRGLNTDRTASAVIRWHALLQNLRRGHYEFGVDTAPVVRLASAFDELRPRDLNRPAPAHDPARPVIA